MASWRQHRGIVLGTWIRRQMGGSMPRSVIFNSQIGSLEFAVGILADCRSKADGGNGSPHGAICHFHIRAPITSDSSGRGEKQEIAFAGSQRPHLGLHARPVPHDKMWMNAV